MPSMSRGSRSSRSRRACEKPLTAMSSLVRGFFWGAPGGIRTPNLLIRSQMLYPLSYGRLPAALT